MSEVGLNSDQGTRRADARRNRERILDAAGRLLAHSPAATLGEIASAAGVSRSTLYRRFRDRDELIAAVSERSGERHSPSAGDPAAGRPHGPAATADGPLPAGRLGRGRSIELDAIQVFDVVPPAQLPEQLVAEAQRVAQVPVALYVLDIDGTHLLWVAGPRRLPEQFATPLAIGPELDAEGLSQLRSELERFPGVELYPLWLRGRASGVLIAFGRPRGPLADLARQAAAAVTLADRHTDTFARAQRRKHPLAAAEIQQSLLPPRISRISGGEVAGNVLPSYEVAGDWFDIVENHDGLWITLADGLGGSTRAAASSAVAMGALRASRRSGGGLTEALVAMHRTLTEMPGPREEMTAIAVCWDPVSERLRAASSGHSAPLIFRAEGGVERILPAPSPGLGGRRRPRPTEAEAGLDAGDRLVLVSDGVLSEAEGGAGLELDQLVDAVAARGGSAAETVRAIHSAALANSRGELADDATAVCLLVG